MGLSYNSANQDKTSTLVYDGKNPLFDGNVKAGTGMNPLLCYISELMKNLFGRIEFSCINLDDLGIKCPDPEKTKECVIIEYLVNQIQQAQDTASTLTEALQTIKNTVGLFTDEQVKVNKAGTSGYLQDKLVGAPGALTLIDDTLFISGTVPIGITATITKGRIGDFDGTGKGKVNTDVWGWAIRNGLNGTDNVLGLFPRFSVDTSLSGIIDGQDNFTIEKTNIKSLTIPISGSIDPALENDLSLDIPVSKRSHHFGLAQVHDVLTPDEGSDLFLKTKAKDFKHAHSFQLTASLDNANPIPIALLPKHITEIPIQRIIP